MLQVSEATLARKLLAIGMTPLLTERRGFDGLAGPSDAWLRTAVHIDGTADPYCTRRFAKSGPVSRVGRVMPYVTRMALRSRPRAAGAPGAL